MSNTFNIKRFWNYFKYDLNSAKKNYGLSLLIVGAMPVFCFIFMELFTLLFSGEFGNNGLFNKCFAYCLAYGIVLITFPPKQYGGLTDKRLGSQWLMIPASRLEKWTSLLLLTCVVVPVLVTAELIITDSLLGLLFSGAYGTTAVAFMWEQFGQLWQYIGAAGAGIAMSWQVALYLCFCEMILFFTLGCIWFKRGKIGKTFLTYVLLSVVMGAITSGFFNIFDWDMVYSTTETIDATFVKGINIMIYVSYVLVFAALDVALYFRIKTLKH